MKQKIVINNQKMTLDPSQLIQSGGEGMVFALGDTAVKLYHQAQANHADKLRQLLNLHLPANVLAACALVQDNKGRVIGFQMPKLPDDSQPLKQLSNPLYWRKNSLQTRDVVQLFHHIHQTLNQLHQNNIVTGDFNDQNVFFSALIPHPSAFFIDSDSYQFDRFPCPVANLNFLDPTLYQVTDFSQRPYFTTDTDWYAYFVLLVKSLLQVHPYGGVHKQHKSLQARAAAGISVLDSAVTYPQRARHPETLSDDLLHHLHRVFEKGHRGLFPLYLLNDYANSLLVCKQCGQAYPRQRSGCPTCHQQTPVPQIMTGRLRQLLAVEGFIECVAVQPNGRILVVARLGNVYKLFRMGIGGKVEEMVLFNGRPHYRCAVFGNAIFGQHLVVNPPHSQQLLVLDISGPQPQKVTMLETADFLGTAVFATTPNYLYRIAGNWIMRGSLQNGLYVEDAITTAHKAQTQFFGSPYSDTIAGYHRIFAETNYFLIDPHGASYDIPVPAPALGTSVAETAVAFSKDTVAILRKMGVNGRYTSHSHIANLKGEMLHKTQETADDLAPIAQHYPFTDKLHYPTPPYKLLPTGFTDRGDVRLLHHPNGLLIQELSSLHFIDFGA